MREETVSSKRIYQGRMLGLRDDTVKLENGVISHREICEHPGAVAIIAITNKQELVLIRQYRKPIDRIIHEIPAGLFKPNESLEQAALRELEEETGYQAGKIKAALSAFTSPGYSTEILHYFLATDLTFTQKSPDGDEDIDVELVSFDKARKMITEGIIDDNKTLIGIYIACGNLYQNL